VQKIDALRQAFDELSWRLPLDVLPTIREPGLVLGAGTLLARMHRNRRGEEWLALDADEERLLALLSAVSGRQISPRVMHHLSRASQQWRHGDKVMAHIEISFARLPRLETKDDAFRLFLAEDLLAKGFTPERLTLDLGFDARLLKYDPEEPRDWKGRWTRVPGSATTEAQDAVVPKAAFSRPSSFLGPVTRIAIAALKIFAKRFNVAAIFFDAIFIPTPNDGGIVEGDVPGMSGVRYRREGPTLNLEITAAADDGSQVTVWTARRPDGFYVEKNGNPLGRDLDDSIYLNVDAVTAALVKAGADLPTGGPTTGSNSEEGAKENVDPSVSSREPKLCPDPSPDQKGGRNKIFDIAYPEYVNDEIVNPGLPPLPPALAFSLSNPISGSDVHFDGCKYTTGDLQEHKGHYADLVAKPFFTDEDEGKLTNEFIEQAERQIQANTARNMITGRVNTIQWNFDERETADFAWNIFRKNKFLGEGLIRIHYVPYWELTDELYPDPEEQNAIEKSASHKTPIERYQVDWI
jgi:hypothetical protein